jgi:hypothetical protein
MAKTRTSPQGAVPARAPSSRSLSLWATCIGVPLLACGVWLLVTQADREQLLHRDSAAKARAASEREKAYAGGKFADFPRTAKVEADPATVGFVHHAHAGGYLVQVQGAVKANTSLVRVPYTATIDAVEASEILPSFSALVDVRADDVVKIVAPALGSDGDTLLKGREMGRFKVVAVLVALRRGLDTSLSQRAAQLSLWAKATVPGRFDNELFLEPSVASRCLDAADRTSWEKAVASAAADRRALLDVLKQASTAMVASMFNATKPDDITLEDFAWAHGVLRTRSWPRPHPRHLAVVPLLDLNDQRASDGWKAATRSDRSVSATLHFDDTTMKVHLVTLTSLPRGAYPVVRDDDGALPLAPSVTRRLYGFYDAGREVGAVLSHAEALFASLDPALECSRGRWLYFNASTGAPSERLAACTAAMLGVPVESPKVTSFLRLHAKRAAQELYNPESLFACRSLADKRSGTEEARQALQIIETQTWTRARLLRVSELLATL